jgi:hypothetical protein
MNITAIPHRWYSDENDKSAVLVTFQAWSDTGRGTLIGYLHQTISVHGVMTSVNMVHAREWMKMVERNNLVLRSSEWEPSWFRAASTRTEERAARRATERKSRPMKEKETTISSPKLVSRLRVPKEKKPKLVTSPPREPKEKKPKVILRKRREGFSSLFDEE